MEKKHFYLNQRLNRAEKEANDNEWFKMNLKELDKMSFSNSEIFAGPADTTSRYRTMRINYDLFNGIINKDDLQHVIKPYGEDVGDLPADFTNKDIISGKIKSLIGAEMKRPFSWRVIAVNEEATTRREQEETERLKQFVVNSAIAPIKQQLEIKYAEQSKGKELSDEEKQQINQSMQQELQSMTPIEVKRYMEREHQDPAEVLGNQILEYLIQRDKLKNKFNKAWKHGLISGREIFWVGAMNGQPIVKVINPLRFDCEISDESEYIEDRGWACYEMYLTPTEIIRYFGSELTDTEQKALFDEFHGHMLTGEFTFRENGRIKAGIRCIHGEWKALKPVKFVKGIDTSTGEYYEEIVDETYKMNPSIGDIEIETLWIPYKYEGYKIGKDKYAFLREVPGQNKEIDNLYDCKLSYVGAIYDELNSEATSLVERMKYYQYLYSTIMYRIEILMATDEGKQMLFNINTIPKSANMDIYQWMHFFKINKIGFVDPTEEGNRDIDVTKAAKEIDMSLVSDIQKYMMLAEYIEKRCGEAVGITKVIEGQIEERQAVRNVQQAQSNSSNILEPYFDLHNTVKRNVLQALIEVAKATYIEVQPKALNYVLDDMSRRMLQMDYDLLDNSIYGIFVSDSISADKALQTMESLAMAAVQNQKSEMSTILAVLKSNSPTEVEDILKADEKERYSREQAAAESEQKSKLEIEEKIRAWEKEKLQLEHANKMEEIQLKGELDLRQQAVLALGFNEDKDMDKDNVPDVLEVAKISLDTKLKEKKLSIEEKKLEQQKAEHEDKMKLENKKLNSKN